MGMGGMAVEEEGKHEQEVFLLALAFSICHKMLFFPHFLILDERWRR